MIVCADDFGLAEDINRAVIDLAERNRITAVSCMVALGSFRRDDLLHLVNSSRSLDLGLHLTMTGFRPASLASDVRSLLGPNGCFRSFSGLLGTCLQHRIDRDDVAREVAAQYAMFVAAAGRPPDFLDSHLHVHQFPCIRDGVLQFLQALPPQAMPYVRNTAMPVSKILRQRVAFFKCLAIGYFGCTFRYALDKQRVPTNRGFAGVYAYGHQGPYSSKLRQFIAHMEDQNGILVTHPGRNEPWRNAEYEALRDADRLAGRTNRFRREATPHERHD